MENFAEQLLRPLADLLTTFLNFIPNLLAMLIIVGVGFFVAWAARLVISKALAAASLDTWCDGSGVTVAVRKTGVWKLPSEMIAGTLYAVILIIFIMTGLSALEFKAIDDLIARFFLYLPRAISAAVILVVGYFITGFIARAVLIAAVNGGYHHAKAFAEAIRVLLVVLIIAMALEQLQIAPLIVLAAFSIVFGGMVLALAIAFGVGGIDAAKRILAGRTEEKKAEGRDIEHL